MKKIAFLILAFALAATTAAAQNAKKVLAKAQLANEYFMKTWPDPTKPTFVKKERSSNLWTRAVYYEGLMALYAIDKQQKYIDYTDTWGNFHKWDVRDGIKTRNADNQCCGQVYLERFDMTGDSSMIKNLIANFDAQIAEDNADFAKQRETRKFWWWIDAIQMAMPALTHLSQITGNTKYKHEAKLLYTWIRNKEDGGLFNTEEGLWWRDADFNPPYKESDGANCYWSRGNGWVYAALCRAMNHIEEGCGFRKMLMNDFLTMTKALVKLQRKDGFWNVSLTSPATYPGPETSGTALFLYGIAWGINNGVLSKAEYKPVCDKAWKALSKVVHKDGFLGYVQGTGKEPKDGQPVTFDSKPDFEDYGLGCFLLGATEYYKMINK
ncbi:MAG: glycoside hydrolase family 88 protein, partial [Prevotellaceae bacterium]|nr:glycoside hydrolase family 88 protein [Prevotellaceae bacterium]